MFCRCCPARPPMMIPEEVMPRRHKGPNGYIPKGTGNGNGYLPHNTDYHLSTMHDIHDMDSTRDIHEMDSFTPMLAAHKVQENENSDPKVCISYFKKKIYI